MPGCRPARFDHGGARGAALSAARRTGLLVALAMLAFAANSLLCRVALRDTAIDAATFTTVRIVSGALILWLIVRLRNGPGIPEGSWWSGFALFAYAAGFSFAYLSLPAAVGALVLFGAVQVTMIGYGLWHGERFRAVQLSGFALAVLGLVGLLSPGLAAPPLGSAALMLAAGVAWGVYSLLGRQFKKPLVATAGNFLRALPFTLVLSLVLLSQLRFDTAGLVYAVLSGALASGVGYAIWYAALPGISATNAATVQLSVPVIAALGAVLFLGEAISWRLVLCSVAILGGIALVFASARRRVP